MRVLVAVGMVLVLVASAPAGVAGQRALTLEAAVEASLDGNASLRAARRGLDGARAQVREAWGSVMPSVHFSGSYTRNLDVPQFFVPAQFIDPDAPEGSMVPIPGGTDNAWLAQARAEQPLFNAAAFLGVGAADRYAAYEEEVVRGEAQQVVTRTRLRYYDALLAQEQLRLTSESVARVERVLDETRKLHRAGLSSEYEVLRLEVELANLEPNLRRSRNAVSASRRALAVEMGADTADWELVGSLIALEVPSAPAAVSSPGSGNTAATDALLLGRATAPETLPVADVVVAARVARSDLRQLGLMRSLRETERRVERSQYLPRVSLFGTWSASAQGDGRPEFFGTQGFSMRAVGIQVDVPLFSGLQRPARVSRMGSVVDQLDAQLGYARDQAANEVETLHDQVVESAARVSAQRRAVSQATRGWEIAQAEYRAGTVGQLQVTDAELALRQSEFNYAQAVHDYLTAQARLDLAVGRVPMVDEGGQIAQLDGTVDR
jgi:outer membrane protein